MCLSVCVVRRPLFVVCRLLQVACRVWCCLLVAVCRCVFLFVDSWLLVDYLSGVWYLFFVGKYMSCDGSVCVV